MFTCWPNGAHIQHGAQAGLQIQCEIWMKLKHKWWREKIIPEASKRNFLIFTSVLFAVACNLSLRRSSNWKASRWKRNFTTRLIRLQMQETVSCRAWRHSRCNPVVYSALSRHGASALCHRPLDGQIASLKPGAPSAVDPGVEFAAWHGWLSGKLPCNRTKLRLVES